MRGGIEGVDNEENVGDRDDGQREVIERTGKRKEWIKGGQGGKREREGRREGG